MSQFRPVEEETYQAYAIPGQGMDGKSFAKLCKDCNLIDKKFSATDADLIFAKVVERGQRRVSMEQFQIALQLVAEKKAVELSAVLRSVGVSEGPVLRATHAEPVRFHDDHAQKGYPSQSGSASLRVPIMTKFNVKDALTDSSPSASPCSLPGKLNSMSSVGSSRHGRSESDADSVDPNQERRRDVPAAVEETFKSFCAGRPDMESKQFYKLCKECSFLDSGVEAADVDLIFTKVRKRQLRISLEQFLSALQMLASRLALSEAEVWEIVGTKSPTHSGTVAANVRLHEDMTASHRERLKNSPRPSHSSGSDEEDNGGRRKERPKGTPCIGVSLTYLVEDFKLLAAAEAGKADPSFRELQRSFWLKKKVSDLEPDQTVRTSEAHGLITGKSLIFSGGQGEASSFDIVEGETVYARVTDNMAMTVHKTLEEATGDGPAITGLQIGNEFCPTGFNGSMTHICPRDGQLGSSIADTLRKDQRGRATHFVSWTWDYSVSIVTSALQRAVKSASARVFLWMCFFVNNQHRIIASESTQDPDTLGACFLRNLKEINQMLIIMDRYSEPKYTRRIWTIYEVFEATRNRISMKITLPSSCLEELKDDSVRHIQAAVADSVHIAEATAWSKIDEVTIKELIQKQYGGFGFVESEVRKGLSQSLVALFAEALAGGV
mmetsp:Transcript_74474/g.131725  ORF Transcript_74474/g.131725 Transcript_74474/m.131725 type:complete len:665 (+) Transcript_74474:70-2064(+)